MKCTLWCHLSPIVRAHKVHGWILTMPSDPALPGKWQVIGLGVPLWAVCSQSRECRFVSTDSLQSGVGTTIVVCLHLLWGLWNHFSPSPASACAHPQRLQAATTGPTPDVGALNNPL